MDTQQNLQREQVKERSKINQIFIDLKYKNRTINFDCHYQLIRKKNSIGLNYKQLRILN